MFNNNSEPLISGRGFNACEDGSTHINIYTKGNTELGRSLSHFAYTPFTHPYFGPFNCMEGFWYFMRNGRTDDSLRYLTGMRVKLQGRSVRSQWYPDFKQDILAANYCKVMQHEKIKKTLIESTLPFDHYYIFSARNAKASDILINPRDSDWLVKGWEELREAVKNEVQPTFWVEAEKRYIKK